MKRTSTEKSNFDRSLHNTIGNKTQRKTNSNLKNDRTPKKLYRKMNSQRELKTKN